MSHLVSCEISGLAGRESPVSFKFDRHLNVFFGLNGTGKTSLLKILHSAMSMDGDILKEVPFKSAAVTMYSLTHKQEFTVTISRETSEEEKTTSSREWRVGPDGQPQRVAVRTKRKLNWKYDENLSPDLQATRRWRHRYLPTTRLYLGNPAGAPTGVVYSHEVDYAPGTVDEDSLEQQFAASMRYLWTNYASEVFAAVRASQETGLANILQDVLLAEDNVATPVDALDIQLARRRVETFLTRRGYRNLDEILRNFDSKFMEDNRLRRVVSDINTVEASIEIAVSPLTSLSNLLSKLYSSGKVVEASERGLNVSLSNSTKLDLNLLSSGEKHILRVLVEALISGENTLIIDEPELSLHVDWQKSLVEHLRNLNDQAQLILATHSPEIMADVPDTHIFRL